MSIIPTPQVFRTFVLALALVAGLSVPALANNISVSNISLFQDPTTHTVAVQFNISWENSWRDATNYDAAWVFLKYYNYMAKTWNHATLKCTGSTDSSASNSNSSLTSSSCGFSPGTGTVIDINIPSDNNGVGAFLQRHSASTGGTLSTTKVKLVWDYGHDLLVGDPDTYAANANIQVMAIEMVYIPAGDFKLGSGAASGSSNTASTTTNPTEDRSFYDTVASASISPSVSTTPYSVTSSTAADSLVFTSPNNFFSSKLNAGGPIASGTSAANGTLVQGFPIGYKAFYMMKYEITQGQYKDFLNTLTRTQQASRVACVGDNQFSMTLQACSTTTPSNRNGIRTTDPNGSPNPYVFICDLHTDGDNTKNGRWIAANFLSWLDLESYTSWAGLRPMSEFEYEKAARGPSTPVKLEYAWGTIQIVQATLNAGLAGTKDEISDAAGTSLVGVSNYDTTVNGPMRSGFAAVGSRVPSGGSYWGVMDLSGNVAERVVPVQQGGINPGFGRGFKDVNGNGAFISSDSEAMTYFWPATNNIASNGWRGGAWDGNPQVTSDTATTYNYFLRTSSRTGVSNASDMSPRAAGYGGRAVRTAP
ncbi:MAG: SUMF1/EgtB/PvdO family nonheme iron enzyme [Candidatus Omnitrophica bacterium]|nr:SUMF1/EgtB/PvdO family nonheme iron enzyme [Candidatus Omnitrophota bacterium]